MTKQNEIIKAVIEDAVKNRASDIHLEPLESEFRIRYRIDGMLHETQSLPKEQQDSVMAMLKTLAGMDADKKQAPQYGKISMNLENKEWELMVSILPAVHGESAVIKVLDKSGFMLGLEDIGLLPENRKCFKKLINLSSGMILAAGPAGSGKTTTLYAALSHINQKERKIITIEDSVECQLDGINQVQTMPQSDFTFTSGLRSMLIQSPDIIMVGGINEPETAEVSIRLAVTGYLVFSAIHANNAAEAVVRLLNMGIKPYLAASAVQGVLAQRLVRTICPSCREPHNPSKEEISELSLTAGESEHLELYKGKGCSACNNTGFKGRMAVHELLIMNDSLRESVLKGASGSVLYNKAKECGMVTLKEDGMKKVKRGYTTIGEILRVVKNV